MEIDTIRTASSASGDSIDGLMDVTEIDTAAVVDMAADSSVYLERRGARTFLVPA